MGFLNAMKCVSVWLLTPKGNRSKKNTHFPSHPLPHPLKKHDGYKKRGEKLEGEKQDVSTHGVKKVKFIPSDF